MHQVANLVASGEAAVDEVPVGGDVGVRDIAEEVEGVSPLVVRAEEVIAVGRSYKKHMSVFVTTKTQSRGSAANSRRTLFLPLLPDTVQVGMVQVEQRVTR